MPALIPNLTMFAIYLAIILGIAVWTSRRNKSLSDFVLGGRSLNSYVAAISAQASDFSGWLLLALPGAAYVGGLGASWIAIGLAIGLYLNWRVIAGRLRAYTERAGTLEKEGGSITISDYFANRFEDRRHILRVLSAVVIIFFSIYLVAAELVAAGILIDQVFGIEVWIGLSLAMLIIVAYTFLGGFLAVSFTDFFQGILMWVAIIVVPIVVVVSLGGFDALIGGLESKNPDLLAMTAEVGIADTEGWTTSGSLGAVGIASGLAWGLGYFGQPHILARFMGIRSVSAVPKARKIAVAWGVTGMVAALLVGLSGIVFFSGQLSNPEAVYIGLVQDVLNPWIGAILLAAIVGAIMSTADSILLVASSALSEDFYREFLGRGASDARLLWVGRGTVVAVGIVAYVLALGSGDSVLNLVAYSWGGFGAAFGPIIIMSLFWRKMNWVGAFAGMVSGGATVVIWKQIDPFGLGLYEILPGVLVSFACIFLFNFFGPSPSEQMHADFDAIDSGENM